MALQPGICDVRGADGKRCGLPVSMDGNRFQVCSVHGIVCMAQFGCGDGCSHCTHQHLCAECAKLDT